MTVDALAVFVYATLGMVGILLIVVLTAWWHTISRFDAKYDRLDAKHDQVMAVLTDVVKSLARIEGMLSGEQELRRDHAIRIGRIEDRLIDRAGMGS